MHVSNTKINNKESQFEKNFYVEHLSSSTKIVNKSKTTTFLCDLPILDNFSTHTIKIKLLFKKVNI